MAGLLDAFTIGFSSEGLKEFEQNLKNNERELDKYEKQVIKLEAELEELEKAEKKNAKAIKEVSAALETAKSQVEHFGQSVKVMKEQSEYQLLQLKKNFGGLVKTLGLLAVTGVAIKKSLEFYEQGEQLDFLAQKTGVAVEKLQELGGAAKKYGGSAEGIAGTLENLRENGYSDPEGALENIAAKMEKMGNDRQKMDFANSLGIDEGTTRLLMQGVARYREELKRAAKYKLYTKEDIERMRDYRQIQSDIRMGMESIFGALSRLLLPAIIQVAKIIRSITDWLAEHEGAVKLAGIFLGIAAAVGAITVAVGLLNIALKFLLANPVVLTIVAVIAAITLLIGIINDFIVFLQGGDSIIGEILEKLGYDTERLRNDLNAFFQNLGQWISVAIEAIKAFGQKCAEIFNKIAQFAQKVWNAIPEPLRNLIAKGLNMALSVNPVTAPIMAAKRALEPYRKHELNAVPAGAISTHYQTQAINNNNNNNTQNINENNNRNMNNLANTKNNNKVVKIDSVNIQTQSSDPRAVANSLQTISDFDDGMVIL